MWQALPRLLWYGVIWFCIITTLSLIVFMAMPPLLNCSPDPEAYTCPVWLVPFQILSIPGLATIIPTVIAVPVFGFIAAKRKTRR